MLISLIAAMDRHRLIGANNQMPWHLPADLKYFKRLTLGKPIVMGRKTFESLGKPLPGRTNIVVSRYPERFSEQAVSVYPSWEAVRQHCQAQFEREVMVIGGSQLFEAVLPVAHRLYITRIDHEFVGDRYFPSWDQEIWRCVSRESHEVDDKNPYPYCFEVWER